MDELTRLQLLEGLGARHDDRLRGKILQRLLELAFHRAGYRLVDERMSEGTDFDVCHRQRSSERYSLEVRTTGGFTVPVKEEDLRLMDERACDGYQTGLAALRIGPGGRWVFIQRQWLLPPSIRLAIGSSAGWEDLARTINDAFDDVLEQLGPVAALDGLEGLAREVEQARL